MKKLSIEQKAQAYDTALERAKKWYNAPNIDKMPTYGSRIIEEIFPELAECEDEEIRKELIDYHKRKLTVAGYSYAHEKWIAWLEKQGEQKTADKVEPKFKVGDWLQYRKSKPFLVEEITKQGYINGISCLPFDWENEIHLWTIDDSKDGDVLATHGCIVIFKEIDGLNIKCHCTYHFMNNPSFYVNTLQNKSVFHPATKEQRAFF